MKLPPMPYQVHFVRKPAQVFESDVFQRFYDAQKFAMQRQRDLRADYVTIREVDRKELEQGEAH